jgi:hypothetical protein
MGWGRLGRCGGGQRCCGESVRGAHLCAQHFDLVLDPREDPILVLIVLGPKVVIQRRSPTEGLGAVGTRNFAGRFLLDDDAGVFGSRMPL